MYFFFYKEIIKEDLTQEVEIIIYFRGNETKVQSVLIDFLNV